MAKLLGRGPSPSLTGIIVWCLLIVVKANGLYEPVVADKLVTGEVLSLKEEVALLEKQLTALTMRRREDYQLLENNLKKYILETAKQFSDMDIQAELRDLKEELRKIREPIPKNNSKERLTMKWLSQAIVELRKEVADVQQSSSETHTPVVYDGLKDLQNDMQQLKLEVESVRSRQQTVELQMADLEAEVEESMADLRKSVIAHGNPGPLASTIDFIEPQAEHKLRHQRALRQKIQKLDHAQKQMKHELRQLKSHHIEDRLNHLDTEQRRLANSNFNLSREISSLEKMHSSVLELFENVERIQTKFDKDMPDVRREISKMEFNFAQLNSQQELIREDGHNRGKVIQAIAVSVSTMQAERDLIKKHQDQLTGIQMDLRSVDQNTTSNNNKVNQTPMAFNGSDSNILVNWPEDCSVVNFTGNGFYLLASPGHGHPLTAYCNENWTMVQQRFDGSVDFNRSWEEYSSGFGVSTSEFWIGNEKLHQISQDNCTRLKVEMEDIYDNFWYAEYGYFKVESRESGYRLLISDYSGNASDALNYQNHMEFSSVDVDRDISNNHCAANYEGGFWYSHCQHANLNGRYNLGLTWFDSTRNEWIAVKRSRLFVGKDPVCLEEASNKAILEDRTERNMLRSGSSKSIKVTT